MRAAEAERERKRQARIAEYRALLVEGPVLLIPLTNRMSYSFNPNTLVPLGALGTVFPTMRLTDDWGVLEVSGGALLNIPGRKASVPAGGRGKGWTLELNSGWKIAPGERPGDQTLRKE